MFPRRTLATALRYSCTPSRLRPLLLLPNPKSGEFSSGLFPLRFNFFNLRSEWSFFTPLQKFLQLIIVPFRFYINRSIRFVHHKTRNMQFPRLPIGRVTKTNTLHFAENFYIYVFHDRLIPPSS